MITEDAPDLPNVLDLGVEVREGFTLEVLGHPRPFYLKQYGVKLSTGYVFGDGDENVLIKGVVVIESCVLMPGPMLSRSMGMRLYVVEAGNYHPGSVFLAGEDATDQMLVELALASLIIQGVQVC